MPILFVYLIKVKMEKNRNLTYDDYVNTDMSLKEFKKLRKIVLAKTMRFYGYR